MGAVRETFAVFLRLGLTSFGGPIAHVGHFRHEFVGRRRWMDDAEFADTVALCQSLPGPTSSQVGFAVGLRRAGIAGGIAAWAGFTAPSAVLLGAAGWWLADVPAGPWMTVLHAVAVAVVAHALHGMARTLLPPHGTRRSRRRRRWGCSRRNARRGRCADSCSRLRSRRERRSGRWRSAGLRACGRLRRARPRWGGGHRRSRSPCSRRYLRRRCSRAGPVR